MTNTKLIRETIQNSGIKMQKIAEVLGISRFTLLNKIENRSDFTTTEIHAFCKFLNINKATREKIFFAKDVA